MDTLLDGPAIDEAPEAWIQRQREKAIDQIERADPPDKNNPDARYRLSALIHEHDQGERTCAALMRDHWDPSGIFTMAEINRAIENPDFLEKRHAAEMDRIFLGKLNETITAYEAAPPDKKPRIYVERFDSLEPQLKRPGSLVEKTLDENTLIVVFGEPGIGKTVVLQSLSYHIGAGLRWWASRAARSGLVIYIALEGGQGVRNRFVGLRTRYGESNCNLALIPCSVDLSGRGADVQPLLDAIAAVGRPVLIVIDTLSRALQGGDENSSEGMGSFVKNVDRLRTATGAAVAVVHHSGKDPSKGARGSNVLRGAADTELEVVRDPKTGERKVLVRKQRDIDCLSPLGFAIESVEIGTDPEGASVSVPIAVYRDIRAESDFRQTLRPGTVAGRALAVLENLTMSAPSAPVDSWYTEFAQAHYPDKPKKVSWQAFERANKELLSAGLIGIEKGRVARTGERPQKSSNVFNEDI